MIENLTRYIKYMGGCELITGIEKIKINATLFLFYNFH